MGYDIIEDLKKKKENISLFELCNFPQQRKKLLDYFNPQPSSIPEAIESDDEVNEASIGEKSKYQTLIFFLSFDIFNYNVHIKGLVYSGSSLNVMPLLV